MARSGGREEAGKTNRRVVRGLAAPRWGEEFQQEEKGRGGGWGWGLESRIPGERTGGADKRERQPAPAPDQPPRETPRHPARPGPRDLPGNPLGSLTRTAGGAVRAGVSASPGGRGPAAGRGWGEPRLSPLPPASLPLMAR